MIPLHAPGRFRKDAFAVFGVILEDDRVERGLSIFGDLCDTTRTGSNGIALFEIVADYRPQKFRNRTVLLCSDLS
ncbi:hypothetical protein [Sphingobium baderi]|uniref:Uncharacterized protein n=1 Tax=Sphingobium baderi TaxID=1332080 RepID=A0A0S3F5A9_9SPHN|nr:hypothetical protein [Sphingobium baderi]ALR22860.1 hypothetical protein ATN00_20385 [Sphingobium baderi]PHP21560.1 hypothetical protein CG471_00875 [Sphingobium sp. IP1]